MKRESKRELFCLEYLKDRNATQAALRAKYSPKTAYSIGQSLLKKVEIKYKINRLIEAQLNRIQLSADFVVKELLKLATFDLQDIYNEDGSLLSVSEMPETIRKAIASIEVYNEYTGTGKNKILLGFTKKIKFWDKPHVLEMLGKHLKMFADTSIDNSRHIHLTVEKREEIVADIREAVRTGLI